MTFLIVLGQYPRALIAIVFRLLILMTKCVIITFLGYKGVDFAKSIPRPYQSIQKKSYKSKSGFDYIKNDEILAN